MKIVQKIVENGIRSLLLSSCVVISMAQIPAPDIPSTDEPMHVEVSKKGTKSKWLLVGIGGHENVLHEVGEAVKRSLEFTDLIKVDLMYTPEKLKKQQVLELRQSGYGMVVFMQDNKREGSLEWRVYDTRKGEMQKGYSVKKEGKVVRGWAYALTDSLIELLGQQPFASCKLAYIQQDKKGKMSLIVADFDGSHPQELVGSKNQILGVRWNKDPEDPQVLYSQYTSINIRLMSCDMHKDKTIASSFDGLNMLPTFSEDGKQVVLCLSRDGSSQLYHYGYDVRRKKVGYTRLTYNKGTNICPTFLPNGDIVFCSDFELGKPQLYQLHRDDDSLERLTSGHASSSPQYCAAGNKLVYTKSANGTMQAYTYDLATKKEVQITFDKGHKQECAWSPCGNYIVCGLVDGNIHTVVRYSLLTGTKKILTASEKRCSYPVWSSLLRPFPAVS